MRIYVASSWRNDRQPDVVARLSSLGHEVYDFRHPLPGDDGFHWSSIDPDWQNWTPERYREALKHPIARAGFARDMDALYDCEVCVLVLPCGRSAHLEFGWAAGAGKRTIALLADGEPELMLSMAKRICLTLDEVVTALESMRTRESA